jgi:hypothetical protein
MMVGQREIITQPAHLGPLEISRVILQRDDLLVCFRNQPGPACTLSLRLCDLQLMSTRGQVVTYDPAFTQTIMRGLVAAILGQVTVLSLM